MFRLAFIALFMSAAVVSAVQTTAPIVPKGYHVIIGAFAVQDNAAKFLETAKTAGLTAASGYLPSRKLHYVYLILDKQLTSCLDQVKVIKQNPAYSDAWVRWVDDEQLTKEVAQEVSEEKGLPKEPLKETPQPAAEAVATVEATPEPAVVPVTEEPDLLQNEPVKFLALSEMTLENTETFLSLYNEANDRVVKGKVQVVDTERGRLITQVEGNSYLNLPDPKSKSGRVSLVCNAFGYRPIQQEINFSQPLTDSTASFVEQMGSSLIIKFPLVRYKKGDIQALYNVYFYNDAAIFLPESKFELNELLYMMQENPQYRIRLHGHTNGNYHGKIIEVGPSKNFFAVVEDSRTVVGSAKELSEARAEVIKGYLVANGIEETRMEVKAWGGKKPIYDKHSANAKKNIRVEVEIINE